MIRMATRAAKLQALVERGATAGERRAAARALAKLSNTFVTDDSAVAEGYVAAQHGYPGRWEEDVRGQQVAVFDLPRHQALDFIKGTSVAVKVGTMVWDCQVQGVRLQPRHAPSQVIARPIGMVSAPAGSLGEP